ncbi:hypothetical protein Sm713_44810 [Streptomyces sp. TS71-3]|nr:hypothetical protein Sm713_44810 [Streptomyces sp. TS71-3]
MPAPAPARVAGVELAGPLAFCCGRSAGAERGSAGAERGSAGAERDSSAARSLDACGPWDACDTGRAGADADAAARSAC